MKRRQRKPVLDINGESDSPRRRWPHEQHSNGSPSNPLANLVGHYDSDNDDQEQTRPRAHALNDQVNDFLKEIQSIAPNNPNSNQILKMSNPASYWQECFDEQTGYPYYWHTETNQVTWEMPAELKAFGDRNKQREPIGSHSSHIPQWPNASSNNYNQSPNNIPDGMIPKEVVARNRNRQAGISNKPAKPPSQAEHFKSQRFKKVDDYDDGKIEMITSFGNEESESDESEREETPKKSSLKKPSRCSPTTSQDVSNKAPRSQDSNVPVGPALPPSHYGPQNRETVSKQSQNLQTRKKSPPISSDTEDDILTRLKNQAKLLQSKPSSSISATLTQDSKSSKDLKLSLVPGYEDDSEGEEDSPRKSTTKPLFPISETMCNESDAAVKVARKIETNAGQIRVYEYKNDESNNSRAKADSESSPSVEDKSEEERPEQELKANKFLESIDAPKSFQRKRRIAFDVAPSKSRTPEPAKEEANASSPVVTDGVDRPGFGFQKGESDETEVNKSETQQAAAGSTNSKPAIAFVKSSSTTEPEKENGSTKEISETDKTEVIALIEPVMEKLKFLSEGSPAASAVQVMAIQIQTLQAAWESGDLQESYLRNWLNGTGCELTRLEQTAAPPGWECQWDRSHKRYYYRNTTTGEAQWTYPQTDIAGGTEEMDLCTTPPPPEHEESPIIEMSVQTAATGSSTSSKEPVIKEGETRKETTSPSPPPISTSASRPIIPSPPPPPKINADDMKRSKKRKGSPDALEPEVKRDDASKDKPIGIEPMPPGVEPPAAPEIAYMPASALEAGAVLYGAQQTNPIYAATLAGAGIPLLSAHHQAALMQGQLMHYNPAYHQHLHNQALVAARLQGQEAMQFMVAAEYARVYENNQAMIAKPPMKTPHEATLGSALNSFYSDIASIEKSEKEKVEFQHQPDAVVPMLPVPSTPPIEGETAEAKEKKKKKLKTGIGKKQKEMSSMVAKWQKAQQNYKESH